MGRTPMDESLATRHASSATLGACCIAGRGSRGGTPSLGDATSAKAYRVHKQEYARNRIYVHGTSGRCSSTGTLYSRRESSAPFTSSTGTERM
jgi:hypothetical protein